MSTQTLPSSDPSGRQRVLRCDQGKRRLCTRHGKGLTPFSMALAKRRPRLHRERQTRRASPSRLQGLPGSRERLKKFTLQIPTHPSAGYPI